jgi:HAMP domain-containing protein
MSLRLRIIFTFILITAIPSLLIVHLSVTNSNKILLQTVSSQLDSLSSSVENAVTLYLSGEVNRHNSITSRTSLRNNLKEYLQEPSDEKLLVITNILNDAVESSKGVSWLSIVNNTNDIVTVYKGSSAKGNLGDLTGSYNQIKIYYDPKSHTFTYVGPIILNGEYLGDLHLNTTNELYDGFVKDYAGLGSTGEVIIGSKNNVGDAQFLHLRRFEESTTARDIISKDELNVPIVQALFKNELSGFIATDYRGEQVVASTRYVDASGWGVVTKMDTAEIYSNFIATRNILLSITFLIVTFTGVVSYALALSIARPIEILTKQANSLQDGKNSSGIPKSVLNDKSEIGILARAFKKMAESIKDSTENLEQRVAKRTEEINRISKLLERKLNQTKRLNDLMVGRELKMAELKKQIGELKRKSKGIKK